ncbi:hypothetical protein Calab_0605 [Caldithrix abyssi DSM 13497]|uniref:Chordopoxvirus fusion protein n=1 Tax=Caldithrix abyssi DSM 13497 TaxID=880073 RepID=H1XS84_CALAY|nr:hypothetical protein [Caldithrix abyssi]APF20190.1 hypothetical protein Cabys_3444 [Caldithrix abyssi DSM 13497]EHO40248.1 hypothetical protein Calab_0605 [Caldithrix abyssi DSM 13497]
MLDTFKIYEELKENFGEQAASKLTEVLGQIYQDLSDAVTKKEFNELKEVVADLAEAQKRTEQRLDELTGRVNELVEAQKRTEQRLSELAGRVNELAEAQKRTEQRLDKLAGRVNELAEAQKRTEHRLEELAQAQKQTELQVQKLTRRVGNIEDQLGGISNTIGYSLEDRSFEPLRKLLEDEFAIKVPRLIRRNIVYPSGKFDEINIYGEGRKNGDEIIVIGESKAQFGLKDVKQFLKLLARVKKHLDKPIFPLALAYQFHPRAEEELKNQKIKYYWSYELK